MALVAVIVVAGAFWGRQYYEDRYVGTDFYARVPLDYDMASVSVRNMEGKEIGTAVEYNLTAYNEQGEAVSVSFRVHDPDSDISIGEEQPQPGDYLRLKVSKQLVISWEFLDYADVPAGVVGYADLQST